MILPCPSCGREGNLPDHLGLTDRMLRCRRCGRRFGTVPLRVIPELHRAGPSKDAGRSARDQIQAPPRSFSADSDDDLPVFADRSPFDASFETGAVLGGGPDDSQTELPAFVDGESPAGESPAPGGPEAGSSGLFLADPWYYNVIDSWGRLHFYVALGFGASSLAVLGYFLVSAIVGGHTLNSSITALIVGCVGTIAFLLLSLSATALVILLVDLARNVRALIQRADRNLSGAIDAEDHNRTRLSHPVG
jgi:hypothetical protein